nr:putative flavin dependent monooxygenase [Lachnum palmae]
MHVVVVGAGPTGMGLGLVMAKAGIDVTILERAATTDPRPRAAHMTPVAMRILTRAGLREDVRERGFIPNNHTWRKIDGTPIVSIEDVAQSHNPEAMVALPINELSKLMLEHTMKNDKITVKFSHPVVEVGQDEASAWVLVKKEDGTELKVSGDFVVGCDGATSSVIYPFEKFGYDDMNTIIHPEHCHIVARLTKDGLWRVSYNEDKTMSYQEAVDNVPAKFAVMLPGNPKPEDYKLTGFSVFKQHQRSAPNFRVGRICLAADAAHLCNPWGGLGLSGGFADVTGLAECLVGIHQGKADHSILDKYDEVRRSIFESIISPISTANYLRCSTSDPETVLDGKDQFLSMVAAAKTDPKIKEKINQGVYAICHDFTQYYNDKN